MPTHTSCSGHTSAVNSVPCQIRAVRSRPGFRAPRSIVMLLRLGVSASVSVAKVTKTGVNPGTLRGVYLLKLGPKTMSYCFLANTEESGKFAGILKKKLSWASHWSFVCFPCSEFTLFYTPRAIMASHGRRGSLISPRFCYSPRETTVQLYPGRLQGFSRCLVAFLALLCGGLCSGESDFSILDEARVLAMQMNKLSTEELGVFTMQVRAWSASCIPLFLFFKSTPWLKFCRFLVFSLCENVQVIQQAADWAAVQFESFSRLI